MGCDKGVERADGAASSLEFVAHLPVCERRGLIERGDVELQQEAQQLFSLRLRHGAFHDHELQLRKHDRREHQFAVTQPVHLACDRLEPLALMYDVRTGVGVEQIAHA